MNNTQNNNETINVNEFDKLPADIKLNIFEKTIKPQNEAIIQNIFEKNKNIRSLFENIFNDNNLITPNNLTIPKINTNKLNRIILFDYSLNKQYNNEELSYYLLIELDNDNTITFDSSIYFKNTNKNKISYKIITTLNYDKENKKWTIMHNFPFTDDGSRLTIKGFKQIYKTDIIFLMHYYAFVFLFKTVEKNTSILKDKFTPLVEFQKNIVHGIKPLEQIIQNITKSNNRKLSDKENLNNDLQSLNKVTRSKKSPTKFNNEINNGKLAYNVENYNNVNSNTKKTINISTILKFVLFSISENRVRNDVIPGLKNYNELYNVFNRQ